MKTLVDMFLNILNTYKTTYKDTAYVIKKNV